MKCTITFITLILLSFQMRSQEPINSFPLEITYYKTTHLIFPYPIKGVDRGTRDVLAQKVPGIENVLQVKARTKGFPITNLTVFTSDGKLYPFEISYSPSPTRQNLSFGGNQKVMPQAQGLNDAILDSLSSRILDEKQFLHITRANGSMRLKIWSIYYDHHLLWLCMELRNRSIVDIEPALFKFSIRDTHRARRTAMQEEEITPINLHHLDSIAGSMSKKLVYAFEPFTVSKGKELVCQVSDQRGSRLVSLKVHSGIFARIRSVPRPSKDSVDIQSDK